MQDFRLGDFHDVGREDGEIGEFAGFDGALVVFFESGVGGRERKHSQRLFASDCLLGVPAVGGFAFDAFPGHRCVEFDHRLAAFDGSV